MQITDHPIIRRLEMCGELTPSPDAPICPVCGEEADDFYEDRRGNILGCDWCIKKVDAWEWRSKNNEYGNQV